MITLKFVAEKDTKNTVKFTEVAPKDTRPHVGTIYLLKEDAKGARELEVTITPVL